MARKRVISRTGYVYNIVTVQADFETMSFKESESTIKSVLRISEKELAKELEGKGKIKSFTETEVLFVQDENYFIANARIEDARKKYNEEGEEEENEWLWKSTLEIPMVTAW